MFSPGRRSGRPGGVRVTVSCTWGSRGRDGRSLYITHMHNPHRSSRNLRVKHKLHRIHSGSNTVSIIACPSTGETGVLTLRLTRALVLHHTPPTQRVEVIGTTGTFCMLGTLLNGYLEHLQRGIMHG